MPFSLHECVCDSNLQEAEGCVKYPLAEQFLLKKKKGHMGTGVEVPAISASHAIHVNPGLQLPAVLHLQGVSD